MEQQRKQKVVQQEQEEQEDIQHGPFPVEQLQVHIRIFFFQFGFMFLDDSHLDLSYFQSPNLFVCISFYFYIFSVIVYSSIINQEL